MSYVAVIKTRLLFDLKFVCLSGKKSQDCRRAGISQHGRRFIDSRHQRNQVEEGKGRFEMFEKQLTTNFKNQMWEKGEFSSGLPRTFRVVKAGVDIKYPDVNSCAPTSPASVLLLCCKNSFFKNFVWFVLQVTFESTDRPNTTFASTRNSLSNGPSQSVRKSPGK